MKTIKILILVWVAAWLVGPVRAATPQAVLEDGGTTLRFVDGDTYWSVEEESEEEDPVESLEIFDVPCSDEPEDPPWSEVGSTVTRVVFDPSFAACRPYHCREWFSGFSALASVEGIGNLKLVGMDASLREMFAGCSSLVTLDLSAFKMDGATEMSGMFAGCSALQSLNLSGFDTCWVDSMEQMFDGCRALEVLDLSDFDTSCPSSCRAEGCSGVARDFGRSMLRNHSWRVHR